MYEQLVSKVQLHLDQQFKLPSDLIGEFYDGVKKVLIQNYQCAHQKGATVLVIVIYTEFGATINYVDDSHRFYNQQ